MRHGTWLELPYLECRLDVRCSAIVGVWSELGRK